MSSLFCCHFYPKHPSHSIATYTLEEGTKIYVTEIMNRQLCEIFVVDLRKIQF